MLCSYIKFSCDNVRKHAEAHKNQAEGEYRVQKQGVRKSKRNKAISSWLRDYVG